MADPQGEIPSIFQHTITSKKQIQKQKLELKFYLFNKWRKSKNGFFAPIYT